LEFRQQQQQQQQPSYGMPDIVSGAVVGHLSAQPSPIPSHVDSASDMQGYPSTITSSSSSSSSARAHGLDRRLHLGTGFSSGLPRVRLAAGSSSPGTVAADVAATASVQSATQEPWTAAPGHPARNCLDTASGSLSEQAAASLAQMAEFPLPQ
jgi:hypothetical protein